MALTFLRVLLSTATDYKLRHINVHAASISFYAFFSIFPLLAFLAYVASQMAGETDASGGTRLVLQLVHEFLPGSQRWLEQGLANVIAANRAANWMNGALLAWAGFSLFTAIESVLEHLPQHEHQAHRSHLARAFYTLITFALCAFLALAVLTSELALRTGKLPPLFADLPAPLYTMLLFAFRSGLMTLITSVAVVGTLYKALIPFRIRARYAYGCAVLFTALLFVSETLFRFYLSQQQAAFQSSYGTFSTLVVLALWVHFLVNVGIAGALFAYHWELRARRLANGGITFTEEEDRRAA